MERVLAAAVAVTVVVALMTIISAGPADASEPRIIIVSGKPLTHEVVISNWNVIASMVRSVVNGRIDRADTLSGRPRLRISMFWGERWVEYMIRGEAASALRPYQANQFGSLYPAWRGSPALMALPWVGGWPRVVPARALAILKGYEIPIALDDA
jgi:hypothetical protein